LLLLPHGVDVALSAANDAAPFAPLDVDK